MSCDVSETFKAIQCACCSWVASELSKWTETAICVYILTHVETPTIIVSVPICVYVKVKMNILVSVKKSLKCLGKAKLWSRFNNHF